MLCKAGAHQQGDVRAEIYLKSEGRREVGYGPTIDDIGTTAIFLECGLGRRSKREVGQTNKISSLVLTCVAETCAQITLAGKVA